MRERDRIGHMLKLKDLHVVMAVAQAGSMNKAAQILNTTQPAVTRSVRDLERALGVSLFDRGPRGVEPSPYGRVLLDGGSSIFDELRQIAKKIEFLSDPTMGSLRIGCSPLLGASFVAAVIDDVSRHYPLIEFEIIAAPIEMGYHQLIQREIDLLITRKVGPVDDEQVVFEPLFDDFLVVVSGSEHPWSRRRRKIQLSELTNEMWVLTPSDYVLGADVLKAFRRSGVNQPRPTVITSAQDVRLSLVATGRFLTIFPASALKYPSKKPDIWVLPVDLPIASVPNGMVTLKKRMLNPVVQLVMKHAREVAKVFAKADPHNLLGR
jgi:DNA-binding transcriptional LysR family regulator